MRRVPVAAAFLSCSLAALASWASPPEDLANPDADLPIPPPQDFARFPLDDVGNPVGPFICGPNEVTVVAAGPDGGPERLSVVRAGRVVWQKTVRSEGIFGPHLVPLWCFDVTGDGHPELLVTEQTGGSHCCNEETLVSLTDRPRVLLHFDDGGWGGNLVPLDVGAGAPYPLYAQIDPEGSPYHPVCGSHADRPFFPLVYALRGGRYVRAGRSYRQVMLAIRARAQDELAQEIADNGVSVFFCQAPFEILTTSLALGDWPAVRRTLPEEVREMLERERRFVARLAAPGR